MSVAVGWAVGYPIAFAVLVALALRRLHLTLRVYLRRVIGIPLCTAVAMGAGALARWATLSMHPGVRFAAVCAATLAVLGVLLAYTQGISPRSVGRALKSS